MAEDKPKVNVKEDGTELKYGDEGYLIAGKYKTLEDAEKGIKEGEKKITTLGQGKSTSDKALLEFQKKLLSHEPVKPGVSQKTPEEIRSEKIEGFKKVFEDPKGGGPAAAYEFVEKMIEDSHAARDSSSKEAKKRQQSVDAIGTAEYNRVRGIADETAGLAANKERQKEFDLLAPTMKEIWAKMPLSSRVPEMMETVFFAARAKASPELREQIVQEIKAGMGTIGSGVKGEEPKTADEKTIDGITEQAEQDASKL